jgi:hypothetical protein
VRQWFLVLRQPVTAILVLANIGAVVLLVANALDREGIVALQDDSPRPSGTSVDPLAFPDKPLDADALRDSALFHATRRFYVAPPEPPAPAQRPDYRLTGTIAIPGKPTTALLVSNAAGTPLKVRVGDAVDGWIVESVEPQRVVLKLGQETVEVAVARPTQPAKLLTGSALDKRLAPNRVNPGR